MVIQDTHTIDLEGDMSTISIDSIRTRLYDIAYVHTLLMEMKMFIKSR